MVESVSKAKQFAKTHALVVGPASTKDNNPLNIPVNDDDSGSDQEMHQEDEELSAYLRGKKTPGLRLSTVNVDEIE